MQTVFAAIATLASASFAVAVGRQYLTRHRPYQLAWSIALAMFATASLALAVGAGWHWTSLDFRVYYLFGAMLNVPWLALGTVLLLASRATALFYRDLLLAFSVAAVLVIATTTIPHAAFAVPAGSVPNGNTFLAGPPRVFAAVAGGVGTLIVLAGAVVSALAMRGKRHLRTRFEGNLLIALGVLIAASGGVLTFLGDTAGNAVALAIGATVMFIGFGRASRPIVAPASQPAGQPAPAQPIAPQRAAAEPPDGPVA